MFVYGARDNAGSSFFFEAFQYAVMNEIACLLWKSYICRFSLSSDLLFTRMSFPKGLFYASMYL